MDFLTATILSGIAYDMLKHGVMLSADNLKTKLTEWIIDNAQLLAIVNELKHLSLTNEMNESVIEKKIANSTELNKLFANIKSGNTIHQNHSGTGDNVAGPKITYNNQINPQQNTIIKSTRNGITTIDVISPTTGAIISTNAYLGE
jgi:hypothetical protein